MLKRHLLSALVLFSFINVCAYGGGWLDFFIPRRSPDAELQAIAQRWMQERSDLGVGTPDGRVREVVQNPLDNPELIEDFEHLRRLIGWNALLQEVRALVVMDLEGNDLPRRRVLIQELLTAFCAQLGCKPFEGQLARVAGLEQELFRLLRSGSFSWPSFERNVTRLIEVYLGHVKRMMPFPPIGYWNCIIRLLSEQYLAPMIEELEAYDSEDSDLQGIMATNFAAQALQYIHGLFQENQLFHDYNQDLGSLEERARLRNVIGSRRDILLSIRRVLALEYIEQQEAIFVSEDVDDQPDEEKKDDQAEEEAVDGVVLAMNAADAYIAWRALELELEGILGQFNNEEDANALVQVVVDRWRFGGDGLPEAVRLQAEAILDQIRRGESELNVWPALRSQIQGLQNSLQGLFLPLLEEANGRLQLLTHWIEVIINPAVGLLWEPREETLDRILLLNRHAQQLGVIFQFLDDHNLFKLLEFKVQQRLMGAQRYLRQRNFFEQNRQCVLPLVLQEMEVQDDLVEVVRLIVPREGRFCEAILPPELWLLILKELFRSGSMADVINFVSTSLYLHGLALCPRYERVYREDGSYAEIPSTRNVFTEFGHHSILRARYEEAFCYFAYMGCLGLLLDGNFSGMLEVVWRLNDENTGHRVRFDDLFRIQMIQGANAFVYEAINLENPSAQIVRLNHRMLIRVNLIQRMFEFMQSAQIAHDRVINHVLPIEIRTAALTRLQALLRYQRNEDILVDQIWQIHEVVFTAGFSLEQVKEVIDVLKHLCLSRMVGKRKIDINMVHSILTDLFHIAASMGPVPLDEVRRRHALQALREIFEVLPVRYFPAYQKHFKAIQNSAGDFLEDDEESIHALISDILRIMYQRQRNPQIIEVTDDSDEL